MKKKSTLLLLSSLLLAISPNTLEIFKIDEQSSIPTAPPQALLKFLQKNQTYLFQKREGIDMTRGSVIEGEQLFIKHLQGPCQLSASEFAAKHTQEEWEAIVQAGEFEAEVFRICPIIKEHYRMEWSPSLYQFAYTYAYDTGDLPIR